MKLYFFPGPYSILQNTSQPKPSLRACHPAQRHMTLLSDSYPRCVSAQGTSDSRRDQQNLHRFCSLQNLFLETLFSYLFLETLFSPLSTCHTGKCDPERDGQRRNQSVY